MDDAYGSAIYGGLGLTEEEKERIRKQQLMAMGAAMLAGRGNFANNLGQGMLVGMNQGESATTQLRRDKLAEQEMQYRQSQIAAQQRKAQEDAAQAQAQAQYGQRMKEILTNPNPTANLPSRAPTMANAAAVEKMSPRDAQLQSLTAAWNEAAMRGDTKMQSEIDKQMKFVRPNFSTNLIKSKNAQGKTVWLMANDMGEVKEIEGHAPVPNIDWKDLKDRLVAVDSDSTLPGTTLTVGMNPYEKQSLGLRGAELGLSRERLAFEKGGAGGGKPTFHNGQWVYPPSAEFPQGRAMQAGGFQPPVPEGIQKEIAGYKGQVQMIDTAIDMVKKNPNAFSIPRGLATLAGTIPEIVVGAQYTDSEQQARSYLFNIVSKTINERAGAAQTRQEYDRLRTFLPSEIDRPEQVVNKLKGFQTYLNERVRGMGGIRVGDSAVQPSDSKVVDYEEERRRRGF
jgi:hypothetical protein